MSHRRFCNAPHSPPRFIRHCYGLWRPTSVRAEVAPSVTVRLRGARVGESLKRWGVFRALVASLAVGMTCFALPCPRAAHAAGPFPTATTGIATGVGQTTATLTGSVDPFGIDTSYTFYYGPTIDYGESTRTLETGAATGAMSLGVPIEGLQPDTVYHYRLAVRAIYGYGWANGEDRTFMTEKMPLGLQIQLAPEQVPYGGAMMVEGTLSGSDDGYRPVVLQAEPFPYRGGFVNVAMQLTSASGGFAFTVATLAQSKRTAGNSSHPRPGLTSTTRFRVTTLTVPSVTSAVATEHVALRVTAHVGRGPRQRARFYGSVSPPQRHARVEIARIGAEGDQPAAWTTLRPRGGGDSSFSQDVAVHRGRYRVWVRVPNGPQVSWHSEPLLIR